MAYGHDLAFELLGVIAPLAPLGERVVPHGMHDHRRANVASTLGLSQDGMAGRIRRPRHSRR